MKVIIDGRGTGKAKQLLEAAAQTENSAILTQDKRALEVKANSYGIKDVKIFDYEDLENDEISIYTNLYIHKMKSRWGVCYPKNKRIGLAKGLIHIPLDLVTFVIIHEFCHYKYQNHSVYFYNEMSKYIKEPKKVNKILKNYSYCLYLD